jgi:hypothetical protein
MISYLIICCHNIKDLENEIQIQITYFKIFHTTRLFRKIHIFYLLKIIDVADPKRIAKSPDKTIVLMSSGNFMQHGHEIKEVHLNLYIQRKDPEIGSYSLLTVYVETDKGSIEMTYDEGYRGENALEEAATFLTSHLGMSGLILRSILQLENSLEPHA